jgi:SAM-dependent methyltransferase
MTDKPYASIVAFWEECLNAHGDTSFGVGWPRGDADLRYQVMLELVRPVRTRVTLLDFGCGASHFYEYLQSQRSNWIHYSGLDVSNSFLKLSRCKFPDVTYYQVDVLGDPPAPLPVFDYVVMNGIFTYRGSLTHCAMFGYMLQMLRRVAAYTRIGLAFNVMSTHVDWEREDLFHLPLDPLLTFLAREISRHIVVRHDYSLYEYTVYVYMTPTVGNPAAKRLVDAERPA